MCLINWLEAADSHPPTIFRAKQICIIIKTHSAIRLHSSASSRNRLPLKGVSRIWGGFPFIQGTRPRFFIQAPMAELLNSGHEDQKAFVILTGTVIPSISMRTPPHSFSKRWAAFLRPTRRPRATGRCRRKFPFFQPDTIKRELR